MPYHYQNFDKAANYSLKTTKRVQKFYTKQLSNSSKAALANEKQAKKKCRLVVGSQSKINAPKKNTVAFANAIASAQPIAIAGIAASAHHSQSGIKQHPKNKAKSEIPSDTHHIKEQSKKQLDSALGQLGEKRRNGNSIAMISDDHQANAYPSSNNVNKEFKLLAPPPPSPTETGADDGDADKLMASFSVPKLDMTDHSTRGIDDLLAAAFQRLLVISPHEQSSSTLFGDDRHLDSNQPISALNHHKQMYKHLRMRRRDIPFVSIQRQRNPIRKKCSKSGVVAKRNS